MSSTTSRSNGSGKDVSVGSEHWKRVVEGPYCRLDPNPDALELARLALCAVTIVPIRLILICILLSSYYVVARSFLALAPDKPWTHAVNVWLIRWASWLMLKFIGFWKIDVKGLKENAGERGEPRIFVSNHISYVEILYFLAELGPSFVMKRTCLRVPLIGSIATRIMDSVSVDNKGGKEGGSGSEAIAERLLLMFGEEAMASGEVEPAGKDLQALAAERWARGWRGNPLLLFPEGTTSNGSCLLRLKTGVFAGGLPVHPVVVRYGGRRFSPAFESIYISVHVFRMLAEPVNRLRVEYLPRYCPTPEQRADRTLYAKAVQDVFCEATGLPAVESGYADKTKYHRYLSKQFQAHPWGAAAVLLTGPDRHMGLLNGVNPGANGGASSLSKVCVDGTGSAVFDIVDKKKLTTSAIPEEGDNMASVQQGESLNGAAGGDGNMREELLRRRKKEAPVDT